MNREGVVQIFAIRSVPVVAWSSVRPLNLRPRAITVFWLVLGLFIFGTGETLLIAAGIGVSPWTVFAQGLGVTYGIGVGLATFILSIATLLLWIPLKQRPGIGTILNAVIVALTIEYLLPYIPVPQTFVGAFVMAFIGVTVTGLGSGIYLTANLGPGPRDGLMTGLQRVTGLPIAVVRTSIEVSVIIIGWLLGGIAGLGTLMFALGIGPAVSVGLYLTAKLSKPCE